MKKAPWKHIWRHLRIVVYRLRRCRLGSLRLPKPFTVDQLKQHILSYQNGIPGLVIRSGIPVRGKAYQLTERSVCGLQYIYERPVLVIDKFCSSILVNEVWRNHMLRAVAIIIGTIEAKDEEQEELVYSIQNTFHCLVLCNVDTSHINHQQYVEVHELYDHLPKGGFGQGYVLVSQ